MGCKHRPYLLRERFRVSAPPAGTGPRSVQVLARPQNAPPVFGLSSRAACWGARPGAIVNRLALDTLTRRLEPPPRVVMEPVSYWPIPESPRRRRLPGPDGMRHGNRDHDRRMPSASRRSGMAGLPERMRSRWDAGQHRSGRVDRRQRDRCDRSLSIAGSDRHVRSPPRRAGASSAGRGRPDGALGARASSSERTRRPIHTHDDLLAIDRHEAHLSRVTRPNFQPADVGVGIV
jgi:hypothetical protein